MVEPLMRRVEHLVRDGAILLLPRHHSDIFQASDSAIDTYLFIYLLTEVLVNCYLIELNTGAYKCVYYYYYY